MTRYRSVGVPFEAIQIDKDNPDCIVWWLKNIAKYKGNITLQAFADGTHRVQFDHTECIPGDWLIFVNGQVMPRSEEFFRKHHEEVPEDWERCEN